MINLLFCWKAKTAQYENGESLYLNRICVASYNWDGITPSKEREQRGDWIGHINLPSIRLAKGLYEHDTSQLKSKIEQIVTQWFNEAVAKAEGK